MGPHGPLSAERGKALQGLTVGLGIVNVPLQAVLASAVCCACIPSTLWNVTLLSLHYGATSAHTEALYLLSIWCMYLAHVLHGDSK